jgi:hypothetical protein
MSNTTISPYMNLPVPVVGVDPGPDWATDINSCFALVDQHNHSVGQGNQINPSGLDINDDLPLNDNNLTLVRSIRFTPQDSPLALASDLNCAYVSGVDLYYNDGNGNQVQITQNGGVAGSPGSISNLTSPASAAYVSADQTFVWQSDVNTAANLDAGSLLLRNLTANSKALTLSPPAAMGSNFTLTLPSIPGNQSFLSIDTSGNIAAFANTSAGITAAMITNGTITGAKIASGTITAGLLASDSVTTVKILDANVTTAKIADGAVTTAKIADASITEAKLDTTLDAKLNGGGAKAWISYNAVVLTGTYSQTLTTITVTATAHGLSNGQKVLLDFTSGTAPDGYYVVGGAATNSFTVTSGVSTSTSGNVSLTARVKASYNIASISKSSTGNYTLTYTTALADAFPAVGGMSGLGSGQGFIRIETAPTTTTLNIQCISASLAGNDPSYVSVVVFGN